jgi:hypothetical protein
MKNNLPARESGRCAESVQLLNLRHRAGQFYPRPQTADSNYGVIPAGFLNHES